MTTRKLTKEYLRRLVMEEKARLQETLEMKAQRSEQVAKKVREVSADSYASTLEQAMDYYRMCKLKETKLINDLKKLQEVKRELKKRLLKNID